MRSEIVRYVINGLFATLVQYLMLRFNIEVLGFKSAGVANFIASFFGITASFIGSRYYVYRGHCGTVRSQISRFFALYGVIALLNGAVLFVWTDMYGLNYQIGFLVATVLQVLMSYFGNKVLVFKNEV